MVAGAEGSGDYTGESGATPTLNIFLALSLTPYFCREVENVEFPLNGLLQISEN